MGMHTEQLAGRTQQVSSPRRGASPTPAYDVDFNKRAEFDAAGRRQASTEDPRADGAGHGTIVVTTRRQALARRRHPEPAQLYFEGSLGYFGCGLIDGPNIRIKGRVGWSCAENMMAGTVVIEKNAGSTFGAAIRGGDLVCKGDVGARTGIDQKGGTIIVGGRTGAFSGFMMQRGRMVVCGDAGMNLGDSMYDGTIFVGGKIDGLGVDAVEAS